MSQLASPIGVIDVMQMPASAPSAMPAPASLPEPAEQRCAGDTTRAADFGRAVFGAKVRAARAVLGISQDVLAARVGLTQKSIHRIEQGSVEPKLRTVIAIEQFWRDSGLAFEHAADGGFRLVVSSDALCAGK